MTCAATLHTAVTQIATERAVEQLGEIAGRHGVLQCEAAAKAMADALSSLNLQFQFAEILFSGSGRHNFVTSGIWSPSNSNESISLNGYHIGVYFNGLVFCNIHPLGLDLVSWFADFWGVGTRRIHLGPIPLGPDGMRKYVRPCENT